MIEFIAPRKVVLANLKIQMLKPSSNDLIELDTAFPRAVYSYKNAIEI